MKRILFLGLLGLLAWVTALKAAELRIAVLPFEIHAAQDLSYVREGIQDMLSTRLFVPGKITVIDEAKVNQMLSDLKGPLTEAKVREIGQKLGADYVLYGSLTTFGHRASLDAKLIPVKGEKPPLALYADTNSLDDLIPRLSDFAVRAVSYLEGRPMKMATSRVSAPPRAAIVPPTTSQTPSPSPTANISAPQTQAPTNPNRVHPERLFREQPPPVAPSSSTTVAAASPQQQPKKQVQASKYKYSDIDPWPDYPPDEEEDLAPLIEEPAKAEKPKKKKGHFWSKLLPWNWFGGKKKEEEVVISPKEVAPPPPPPPTSEGSATLPAPQASPEPPSGGGSWQWY